MPKGKSAMRVGALMTMIEKGPVPLRCSYCNVKPCYQDPDCAWCGLRLRLLVLNEPNRTRPNLGVIVQGDWWASLPTWPGAPLKGCTWESAQL